MRLSSSRIIATQFIEQQWNKTIALNIYVTCNTVGIAKNFARAVFYDLLEYQGIGVQKPLFSPGNYSHYPVP